MESRNGLMRMGSTKARIRRFPTRIIPFTCVVFGACAPDVSTTFPFQDLPAIPLEPEVRIDGYEANLVHITWIGVDANGRSVLLQPQDNLVRFFGSSGEFLGAFGQEGEGPGEFRNVVRAGWLADTLWVSDTQLSRVTLISPDRQLVRTVPLTNGARPEQDESDQYPTYANAYPYAMFGGDSLLVSVRTATDNAPAAPTDGDPLYLISKEGTIQREVALRPPVIDPYITIERNGGYLFSYIPFFPGSSWTVSPDGSHVAMLTLSMSDPDFAVNIRVVDRNGQDVVNRAYPFEPQTVDDRSLDSAIAVQAARRPPEMRPEVEQKLRDAAPTYYPPAEGLLMGNDGRIWVEMRPIPNGRPWTVLDPSGEPIGQVLLPARAMLHAASQTHLWVVERDEVDVESVVRYRLGGPE